MRLHLAIHDNENPRPLEPGFSHSECGNLERAGLCGNGAFEFRGQQFQDEW
jgi:hypothetical protein